MTYSEVLIARENLNHVNATESTDAKFLYAVSRNKSHLDSVKKHLDSLRKPGDEISEFWKELDEVNKKHAERDDSGTVQYTNVQIDGEIKKAYKKIIGEGNPESAYSKEVEKLRRKFEKAIDTHESNFKKYHQMLDTEVEKDDLRIFWIDLAIVPHGIHPKAMDGCLYFIKEISDGTEEVTEKQ